VRHTAGFAAQLLADVFLPTFCGRDPVTLSPRRIVTNMLLVAALELRYPVRVFVDMESDDFPRLTL
jgi:hypothetical protein